MKSYKFKKENSKKSLKDLKKLISILKNLLNKKIQMIKEYTNIIYNYFKIYALCY